MIGTRTNTPSSVPLVSTPSQYDSSKEIELLKHLNTDLLDRIKNLEDELNSTKMKFEELSNSVRWDKSMNEISVTHPSEPEPSASTPLAPESATINPTSSMEETFNEDKPRVLVYGDSMTRDFGSILQQLMPEYLVQCHTFPGAPIEFVVRDLPLQARNLSKKDIVFILAANNDVPHFSPQRLDNVLKQLSPLCLKTNLVMSSIPYKFNNSKHNSNIFASNQYILSQSSVYKYFYFESNFFLSREMYTKHGLHFNMGGKKHFNNMLYNSLLSIKYTNTRFLLPNLLSTDKDTNFRIDHTSYLCDISCPSLNSSISAHTHSVSSDFSNNTVFFLC